ncbi:putative chromatin regulator PHD family [Helianthus annuus]|nr:putative chromatin regulator PHD family [Helianthus annuus]
MAYPLTKDSILYTNKNPPFIPKTSSFLLLHVCRQKREKKPLTHLRFRPILTPPTTAGAVVCLPVKKRICALHPNLFLDKPFSSFNLNLEYDPRSDHDQEKNQENVQEKDQENGYVDEVENEEEEDGILCAVCQSTDGDAKNPIVFCDGCDLMVHTTCYGAPLTNGVPEGDWFCSKCKSSGILLFVSCYWWGIETDG